MTAPDPQPTPLNPEVLLNVAAEDHMHLWAEVVQLRTRDRQHLARIAALEQAIRDAAPAPAGGDG